MNELLLWMSAKRAGSTQSFRAKAAELGGASHSRSVPLHRLAEWNLSKLGHAEFGPSACGDGWRVAPPTLAAGDYSAPCRAALCGARTPRLLARLADAAGAIQMHIQQQPAGPDIIELIAPNPRQLADTATAAAVPLQWNAPLALISASASPKAIPLEPAEVPIGGWTVSRFSKSGLAWVGSSTQEVAQKQFGLFRFRSDYGTTYVLVEGGRPWACDPAQAKYRVLRRRNRALHYESDDQKLAIPATCRPPTLVERALVLCSGQLPLLRSGYFIYPRVERTVAAAAATLLGQRLN